MRDDPDTALIAQILAEDNEYALATGMAYNLNNDSSSDNEDGDAEYGRSTKPQRKKGKRNGISRGKIKGKSKTDALTPIDDKETARSESSKEDGAIDFNCKDTPINSGEGGETKCKKPKQPRRWSDEEDRIFKLVSASCLLLLCRIFGVVSNSH
jgi:hypothetical protein